MLRHPWATATACRCFVVLVWLAPVISTASSTAAPAVQFDVPALVSCREVVPEGDAPVGPDQRLVEAVLEVSSMIPSGAAGEPAEQLYWLVSPDQTMRVVDYLPRTTMASDVAGNVSVEKRAENNHSLGLGVTGAYQWVLKATPTAGIGGSKEAKVHYELLPPQQLVAASGTIQRGHGVYFKLRSSRRESLEGSKQFRVVFSVGTAWRADWVHVHCLALSGRHTGLLSLAEPRPSGTASFVVALYLEGDAEARSAAERYVAAESQLRRVAQACREQIAHRCYPTVVHKVGSLVAAVEPEIPGDWLQRIIGDVSPETITPFWDKLPEPVQAAASELIDARGALRELSGQPARSGTAGRDTVPATH